MNKKKVDPSAYDSQGNMMDPEETYKTRNYLQQSSPLIKNKNSTKIVLFIHRIRKLLNTIWKSSDRHGNSPSLHSPTATAIVLFHLTMVS